jgi:hypothetical protein
MGRACSMLQWAASCSSHRAQGSCRPRQSVGYGFKGQGQKRQGIGCEPVGATKLLLVTPLGSARSPRHPVRFPYSQVIPTSIPSKFSKADPYEITSARAWTELARTLRVRRGQPRRSGCSISVIAGPRNHRSRPPGSSPRG